MNLTNKESNLPLKPLPIEQPKETTSISLENWIRNKLQENEEMHDYSIATETVRCMLDHHKEIYVAKKEPDFKSQVIELIEGEINDLKVYEKRQIEINEYYNNHSSVASRIKFYNDLLNKIKQL